MYSGMADQVGVLTEIARDDPDRAHRPDRTGTELPIGASSGAPAPLDVGVRRSAGHQLRITPGPRADWISDRT